MESTTSLIAPERRRVRIGFVDLAGAAYLVMVTYLLLRFHGATAQHPYASGFIKFALLATFGECLRHRLSTGFWLVGKLALRAVIWGIFGIWIASAFVIVDSGVHKLSDLGLWPSLWHAFSTSLWLNLLSGYGLFMMMTHFVSDRIIEDGWHSPWKALLHPSFGPWIRITLLSLIFFWIPAHTITFLLPPTYRILFAAYLSVMLGVLLSLGRKPARAHMVTPPRGSAALFLGLMALGLVAGIRPAGATEGGASAYPIGVNTVVPALLPPPGATELFNYIVEVPLYTLNDGAGRSALPAFRANVFAYAPRLVHTWDFTWNGLAFSSGISPVMQRVYTRIGNESDTATNISSVDIQAFYVTWSRNDLHLMFGQDFWIPASKYSAQKLSNPSLNYVTFMPEAALTWLPGRWELSLEPVMEFSTKNASTDYQSGDIFDLDYHVGYRPFPSLPKLQFGVQGNVQTQFTADTLKGAVYDNGYYTRTISVGPQVVYNFTPAIGVALKWQHMVVARNSPAGDRFWIQFAFPL